MISLVMASGDLELYRYLVGITEEDSAAAIDMGAGEAQVSDICTHRERAVGAETDLRRESADLACLRSEVLRSSYWDDSIEVDRIQLAQNVKVVALSNLGNETRYRMVFLTLLVIVAASCGTTGRAANLRRTDQGGIRPDTRTSPSR